MHICGLRGRDKRAAMQYRAAFCGGNGVKSGGIFRAHFMSKNVHEKKMFTRRKKCSREIFQVFDIMFLHL